MAKRNPIYDNGSENQKLIKTYQNMTLFLFVAIVILAIVIGNMRQSTNIITVTPENELVFAPTEGKKAVVAISQITDAKLLTDFEYTSDTQTQGQGYVYGLGHNDMYGDFVFYLYAASDKYITIQYPDGCIVFNYLNSNNTESFYIGLCDLVGGN